MSGSSVRFVDRRVPCYARIVVLVPLGYIASPLDLIPDGPIFFGQIDDLIAVRYSYTLLKKLVDPVALGGCRERARTFFSGKEEDRMNFVIVLSAIWIFLPTLLSMYLIKKIRRHSCHVIKYLATLRSN